MVLPPLDVDPVEALLPHVPDRSLVEERTTIERALHIHLASPPVCCASSRCRVADRGPSLAASSRELTTLPRALAAMLSRLFRSPMLRQFGCVHFEEAALAIAAPASAPSANPPSPQP